MRVVRGVAGIRIRGAPEAVARTEAARVIASAQTEADQIREAARVRAEEYAGAIIREAEMRASALIARAALAHVRATDEVAASIAGLALEVARAVLGREAQSGPDVMRDVTRQALAKLRKARTLLLRVHPDDVALAESSVRRWLPPESHPDVIAVDADAAVERGAVIVESEIGRVDATLSAQLDAIARALAEP